MDNLVLFSFFRIVVSILHWIFYPLWTIPIIINAEIWFFGTKFSGDWALLINFSIGILGIILGVLIFKQKKIAYFGEIVLLILIMSDIAINYLTSMF